MVWFFLLIAGLDSSDIDRLGDTNYRVRQAASAKLGSKGCMAIPLSFALRNHPDAEVRSRVRKPFDSANSRFHDSGVAVALEVFDPTRFPTDWQGYCTHWASVLSERPEWRLTVAKVARMKGFFDGGDYSHIEQPMCERYEIWANMAHIWSWTHNREYMVSEREKKLAVARILPRVVFAAKALHVLRRGLDMKIFDWKRPGTRVFQSWAAGDLEKYWSWEESDY